MLNRFSAIFCCLFALSTSVASLTYGQLAKKTISAERITEAPKIDGIPDVNLFGDNEPSHFFYQNSPDNGALSTNASQVKIHYSDEAIFITARMLDDDPESIPREFGLRDDDEKNSDIFAVYLDTYDKGQNAFAFGVTAAGVQLDANVSANDFDFNWDAVWESAVKIDDDGWTIEMEIPYYAIRFPKQEIQTWGVNFYRGMKKTNEEAYWNFVDSNIDGVVNQSGTLLGIRNVNPPLRLAFLPYMSVVHTIDDGSGSSKTSLNGGLDIKYGINESFTIDMSLIPDFSQVRLDDQILNLSAFEVRFDENRPFFTEGTELFNKNGLFYSRRVGQSNGSVQTITEYDVVKSIPGAAPLINASKLSGRTNKGMGIGFFNAVTNKSYAEIATPVDVDVYTLDENGEREYEYKTVETPYDQHVVNYNVLVVDQNLKNNSNIGIINTNVNRSDGGNNANVTGVDFRLFDKTNTYRVSGFAARSNTYQEEEQEEGAADSLFVNNEGYKYFLFLGKVSGKWQYEVMRNVESENYDINDLGFLRASNEVSYRGRISYNIVKPFWKLNNLWLRVGGNHNKLHTPRTLTEKSVSVNSRVQLKNFWTIRGSHGRNLNDGFDFFESRDGTVWNRPESNWASVSISTDSRKALMLSANKGRWKRNDWDQIDHWHSGSLRYRVNNKLSFTYNIRYNREYNSNGYVSMDDDIREDSGLDDVRVFGVRNIKRMNNVIGVNYVFNNMMGLNLRIRQNWTRVRYFDFKELLDDGELYNINYTGVGTDGEANHDNNFNAFNMNMTYSWQIAPGSFVSAVWIQGITNESKDIGIGYSENLENTLQSPQFNSFSIRLTYFLDYLTIKNSFK
jgi:hypothetical protein